MRKSLRVGICGALLAMGCRDGTPKTRPVTSGRSWTTPPLEAADGGLVAEKLPRVAYRGGRFLRNPKIVTVTFTRDDPTLVARLEQFGDTITRSSWWRDVVDSYCTKPDDCIGEGQAGLNVRLGDDLPQTMRDVDVDDVLVRAAKAGRFGPVTSDTLLLVYLPREVRLTSAFVPEYCAGGARAFHRALAVDEPSAGMVATKLAYAVLPRCSDEAELTATASHELVETTTNPDPAERGFSLVRDSNTLAFASSGMEPVDPCGLITMDEHRAFAAGFVVQRAWSNRAASLGHDPCVPARANRPYLALVPRTPTVRLVKEGEVATITLDARADRSVPSWAVSALDVTGYQERTPYVDVSLDKAVIETGGALNLTIVMRKRNENGLDIVGVVSTLGVISHMWPIAIVMR